MTTEAIGSIGRQSVNRITIPAMITATEPSTSPSTSRWSLLREAVDVLLQATPKGVDLDEVRQHLQRAEGVAEIHDLHAWTLTSGINVVSAHVVVQPGSDPAAVLDEICMCLADDFDMEHSTIQLETTGRQRLEHTLQP